METPLRIVVVGDELVAGLGDPKSLGWVGRVAARTVAPQPPFLCALPVPQETSAALQQRWFAEASLRYSPGTDNRLVIGLGAADLAAGISSARSRLNLATVLDAAEQNRISCLVVGPPPGGADDAAVAELSQSFADVTMRRGVTYVDTFTPLVGHDQWQSDMASGDGRWPRQAGYGLMAWLVLHAGWLPWLGLPEEA